MRKKQGILIIGVIASMIAVTTSAVLANKPTVPVHQPTERDKVNYVYTENKDKSSSSFISEEKVKEIIKNDEGNNKNSKIISIKLKTWEKYQSEDDHSNFTFNKMQPGRMVYVVKESFPDGIQTKAGFVPNAIVMSTYDAETGDPIEVVSGPSEKFK